MAVEGWAVKMQEHALLRREAGYWVVAAKARFSSIPRFAASTVTVALGTYQHTEVYLLFGFRKAGRTYLEVVAVVTVA